MRKVRALLLAIAALAALGACSSPAGSAPQDPGSAPVITITGQPANVTVTAGSISGSLSVTAAVTEGATLSFQWYRNTSASNAGGVKETGATATTANFTIPIGLGVGEYYYFCEVAAPGAVTKRSNAAKVTVSTVSNLPVITISGQPADMTVTEGDTPGSLSVTATVTESASLSYQWYTSAGNGYDDGIIIEGVTTMSYAVPAGLGIGEYYYFCEVTAPGASVRSRVAKVAVVSAGTPAINITVQPKENTEVIAGKISESLSVTAAGFGGAVITGYQWYRNDYNSNYGGTQVLPASMDPDFTIPKDLAAPYEYYYFCEIKASSGADTLIKRSDVAVVKVVEPPLPVISISKEPENAGVTAGAISGSLSVSASVTEGAVLSYQWYRNYYPTPDYYYSSDLIDSATESSFPIPADLLNGVYYYYCEITASGETGEAVPVNSAKAVVTVSYPDTNFVIDLTDNSDPDLIDKGQNVEAVHNTEMVFTVAGTWQTYTWYIDGKEVLSGDTASEYSFNRPVEVYNLTVEVTDGKGNTYSGSCRVTVKEGE